VSRFEGKIGSDGEPPVDAAEILAALAKASGASAEQRKDAVTRYLSASKGWQEAQAILGGAFADEETGLRSGKDE
jgi:hypothetical protein